MKMKNKFLLMTLMSLLSFGCAAENKQKDVGSAIHEAIIEQSTTSDESIIRTELKGNAMLSATSNKVLTKKPDVFEVHAVIAFPYTWSNIYLAFTKDGEKVNLTRADSKMMCTPENEERGCDYVDYLTAELPISFLEANPNGFDLVFEGDDKTDFNVSGEHVQTLLSGLAKIKQ